MRSLTKCAALLAEAALLAAGCGGTSIVPDGPVNLEKLRDSNVPVFWVGESFAGLTLTYADNPGANRVLLAYGTCEAKGGSSCSPPLEIQSCLGYDTVSFLGRRSLAERAVTALKPFNEAARKIGKPLTKINSGIRCG
jgi:hypothetical protein